MARNVLEGPGDAAGTPDGSGRCAAMILVIDNYDSFTYNLVQYLGELGADLEVVRNDATDIERIVAMAPERIVISPGPGTPDQAGVSLEVIRRLGSTTPVLGVCLRHRRHPVEGVQFHPESILTIEGKQLLKNFLATSRP